MSLQYRTRNMGDDRDWLQRRTLCEALLVETVDWWCRNEETEFPISSVISSTLYLFAKRCNPFQESERGIRVRLLESTDNALEEFRNAWPNKSVSSGNALVEDLKITLQNAIAVWAETSISQLPVEQVADQLANCIAAHQYVVFYRRESTRRDGGFFGNG